MELELYIKQPKRYDIAGKEIHLDGNNPKSLVIKHAPLPAQRRLPMYNTFRDVTDSVSDLHKIRFTWTHERNEEGVNVPGEFNQQKAASGSIIFEGDAYQYLKQWLIDDVSAPMNHFEMMVKHVGCGEYRNWIVRSTDISWCEGDVCTIDISLKQKDDALECIKNTWIAHDWQGWFGDTTTPSSGKKHPRFSYCNEVRPNSLLITLWWVMTQLNSVLGPTMIAIALIINTFLGIVIGVLSIINAAIKFINTLGGNIGTLDQKIDDLKKKMITFKDIKDIYAQFYIESAGCGREHPAPLVRDYITNVCKKCGVRADAATVPIFFSQYMNIYTSEDKLLNRGAQQRFNPHYNACYLNVPGERGFRRYDKLSIFKGVWKNITDWWEPGNAPQLTLDELLNELKQLYNAEWRVVNNTLYFQRKDFWHDNKYVFDFSENHPDRNLLLEGLCFEWNEVKQPASCRGMYTADGADVCGNDAMEYMNDLISFGDSNVNPNMEGIMDKTIDFGATKFRLDGASTDYILDAFQQVLNTTFITGSIWNGPFIKSISKVFDEFANYALLLRQETATIPKILLWDGRLDWDEESGYFLPMNAKCYTPHNAHPNAGGNLPRINLHYGRMPYFWHILHMPKSHVSGERLNFAGFTPGYYSLRYVLSGTKIAQYPVKLPNFPMYFQAGYFGTMWDWFHWIDDPNLNPVLNQQFKAKLELCCDTLKRLEVFNNSSAIKLAQKVNLPAKYSDGYITEITVNYKSENDSAPHIEVKGVG